MKIDKEKLLVSFSGGLTSAFMTKWCLENLADKYEMVVVFANTGKEKEETLEFVNDCDKYFNFNTVWVEAKVNPIKGNGTSFKIVDFYTASRNGEPFRDVVKKYGLPNVAFPHCTRELKTVPIHAFVKFLGWEKYYTAIGIRVDEIDRVSKKHKEFRYIYPLVNMIPTKRTDINKFWINQRFTLNLKSYEGNCDLCFKKSDRKLLTLLSENPESHKWWYKLENDFGNGYFLFRQSRSILELLAMSKTNFIHARDESKDIELYTQLSMFDALDVSNGCSESCEAFY